MSVECQVNVKYQSELDIGGRETCSSCIEIDPGFMFNLTLIRCIIQVTTT